jgi:methylphosphotriester-DNA--protein-cysteine methyltransferase
MADNTNKNELKALINQFGMDPEEFKRDAMDLFGINPKKMKKEIRDQVLLWSVISAIGVYMVMKWIGD